MPRNWIELSDGLWTALNGTFWLNSSMLCIRSFLAVHVLVLTTYISNGSSPDIFVLILVIYIVEIRQAGLKHAGAYMR
jgi:hypothetical protein